MCSNNKNDKKNSNKDILYIVVILLVGSIIIPLIVLGLISIPLQGSVTNDWIGFFGGYLGALISGLITLFVLYINRKDNEEAKRNNTVDNEKTKNIIKNNHNDDIRNSVKPILDVWKYGSSDENEGVRIRYYEYGATKDNRFIKCFNFSDIDNRSPSGHFKMELVFENLGLGPVFDLEIIFKTNKDEIHSSDKFTIGLSKKIKVGIYIQNEKLVPQGNEFILQYRDAYGNEYSQSVNFDIDINSNNNKSANFKYISKQELKRVILS